MCDESLKARQRRKQEGYFERYLVGRGIDIGCGPDPVTPDCARCDRPECDGMTLAGYAPKSFDWVYSSHCLEHLDDPWKAIQRWWEVLKPGGYLLVAVPDEDLYEQGHWPSPWNGEHKHTFTIHKTKSWSPVSINVSELVATLPSHRVIWMKLFDTNYNYDTSRGLYDRLTDPGAEATIEFCLQKLVSEGTNA